MQECEVAYICISFKVGVKCKIFFLKFFFFLRISWKGNQVKSIPIEPVRKICSIKSKIV